MIRFTLDHNCFLDYEAEGPRADAVRKLVARHMAGTVEVGLPATSAAERAPDGTLLANFAQFQARLADFGLTGLTILKPVGVFDLSFADWCVLGVDADDALLRAINGVLFESAYDYPDAVESVPEGPERDKAHARWRNRRLDVLGLHTHIRSGADVFVTSDRNFLKETKRVPLAVLGAGTVLTPEAAEQYAAESSA